MAVCFTPVVPHHVRLYVCLDFKTAYRLRQFLSQPSCPATNRCILFTLPKDVQPTAAPGAPESKPQVPAEPKAAPMSRGEPEPKPQAKPEAAKMPEAYQAKGISCLSCCSTMLTNLSLALAVLLSLCVYFHHHFLFPYYLRKLPLNVISWHFIHVCEICAFMCVCKLICVCQMKTKPMFF